MSSPDIRPSTPPKPLPLDKESGFLRIASRDFNTRFMYQLVFNINNLALQYPYVDEVPHFAPLKVGEYLSIIDANKITKISETRLDSLSPWNRKNNKSKQHVFIVDPLVGSCRRADSREDREQSNANEYYAKHPDQKVIKRIFIALATGGIQPAQNSFIVIYYKVDEPLFHQSLVPNRASTSQNQEEEDGFFEEEEEKDDTLIEDKKIKEDPDSQIMSLLDGILFAKAGLQNTRQSSHIDQAAKDLPFKGKRKCAHCNADITVEDNSTVITHYEPFEYLISNSNHITMGHGNRMICIKFSCLKARYPFIDEQCVIANSTVSQAEAKKVFDLIF
uniref:Uncharacterized protein n=1 Tax=Panagrolaimus sp. ES5 TaxID=591445 RepID=A0AC34FI19_9BILA